MAREGIAGAAGEAPRLAVMRDERHLHVLAHGHGLERGGDLERAAHAQRPHRARVEAGDVAARKEDAPGVGRELAVDEVEAGGLAGAVGADQRQQTAGLHAEGDAVDRLDAAERLLEAARLQHRLAHDAPCSGITLATALAPSQEAPDQALREGQHQRDDG